VTRIDVCETPKFVYPDNNYERGGERPGRCATPEKSTSASNWSRNVARPQTRRTPGDLPMSCAPVNTPPPSAPPEAQDVELSPLSWARTVTARK